MDLDRCVYQPQVRSAVFTQTYLYLGQYKTVLLTLGEFALSLFFLDKKITGTPPNLGISRIQIHKSSQVEN